MKDFTAEQLFSILPEFKTIENEAGLQIYPVPDLPCFVYCKGNSDEGFADCPNGHIDLGLAELIAVSWILESDAVRLIEGV